MLRPDVTGTRPVTQTDAPTTITSVTNASQEALNRLALISAGKQFQAQIMSRLNDGTFLVRVADTTARMALPDSAKAGDTVTLTLLSPGPRPTFMLGEAVGEMEQSIAKLLVESTSTGQVGKASASGATSSSAATPDALPSSATASLSQAGRLVDNLLHAAQLDGSSTKIQGQLPLVASAATPTPVLAQAMQSAMEKSGLFYESHLKQWVNGERSLADLAGEPQARFGSLADVGKSSSLLDMMRALETAQALRGDAPNNALQSAALNSETARLISLQLAALEHRRIAWQGELWPGQRVEWDVSEETPRQEAGEPVSSWRSTVRFDMPTLGSISATIRLENGRVQMQIRAPSEATASTLRANGKSLANALEAAGSPLDMLTVSKNEPI